MTMPDQAPQTTQGEDELSKDFLTSLRWLGEGYYGDKLFGEHLRYQHALQGLIASEISKQREQAYADGYKKGVLQNPAVAAYLKEDEAREQARQEVLDELERHYDDNENWYENENGEPVYSIRGFINAKRKKDASD